MAETTRNPDALSEEIERTRDQLAGTIDTIADRVSPKNVARRSADQLRGNAEAVRKKLPQGQGGNSQGTLAHREGESPTSAQGAAHGSPASGSGGTYESSASGAGAADESSASVPGAAQLQATGEVLNANRTLVLAGAGVGLGVLAAVLLWRRSRR